MSTTPVERDDDDGSGTVERDDAPAPARPARQHRASAPETPSLPARAEAYSARRNTDSAFVFRRESFTRELALVRQLHASLRPVAIADTRSADQKHVDELFDTLKQRKARTSSAVLPLCREWRAGRFRGVDDRSFFERVMPILLSVDVELRIKFGMRENDMTWGTCGKLFLGKDRFFSARVEPAGGGPRASSRV